METRNKVFTKVNMLYLYSLLILLITRFVINRIFENYIEEGILLPLSLAFALLASYFPFFVENNFGSDFVERPIHKELSKKDFLKFLVIVLFVNVLSHFLASALEDSFRRFGFSILANKGQSLNLISIMLLALYALVFAPIFEELVFRDFILRRLKVFGNFFAVIVSSLLFAFVHSNVAQFIPSFLLGLILGYAYLQSGSIKTVIYLHIINNLYSLIFNEIIYRFLNNNAIGVYITVELVILAILAIYSLYLLIKDKESEIKTFPQGKINYRMYFFRITSFVIIIVGVINMVLSVRKIGG